MFRASALLLAASALLAQTPPHTPRAKEIAYAAPIGTTG